METKAETKTVKPNVAPVIKEKPSITETVKELEEKLKVAKTASLIKVKNISDNRIQVSGKRLQPGDEGLATAAELSMFYLQLEKV